MPEIKVKPTIEQFRGNKVINLAPRSKFPFAFGVAKAKLIMQNLEEIQKFIEQNDTENDS